MKKFILTVAAAISIGTLSYQIADANPYARGNGYGCGVPGYGQSALNKEGFDAREKFYEESKEIRKELFEKRSEYAEILNADPVDKGQAQEVWSEIFDLQAQIRKLAAEQDVFVGDPNYCLGPNGFYEGDEAKGNFKGNRGYGRRGGGWSKI